MFVVAIILAFATRFWLVLRNRKLAKLEAELLAGNANVTQNKLLQETADLEGTNSFEAAKMAAAYRFYL